MCCFDCTKWGNSGDTSVALYSLQNILSFNKEKEIPMTLNYLLNTLARQAAFKRSGTGNLQSFNDTLLLQIMEVMQQKLVPASERLHE